MESLQDELNKNLKQIMENKREEWQYISEEQLRELNHALERPETEKQAIIERHLGDIGDWMANA
jgi:vacuolar-type H+-ATPase subunit E/Vma4